MQGTTNACILSMIFSDKRLIPKILGGSTSTYFTDAIAYDNSKVCFAHVSVSSGAGLLSGAFSGLINHLPTNSYWYVGASLSCKPTLSIQLDDPNVNGEVA